MAQTVPSPYHCQRSVSKNILGMIDSIPIETSYQAWNELMRCKKSGKKYQVGGDVMEKWSVILFLSICDQVCNCMPVISH